MAINSSNIVVKTISNIGIYGLHSVMGANKRFLLTMSYMEEMNVYEMWKQKVNSESNEVWMRIQIRELCEGSDKCGYTFLTKCDICRGWQIPGLRWLCSWKPMLKAAKGSEDIQDKDYQTQYKYSWSKSVLRLRNIEVYWIFQRNKYKWLLLYNCIKFKCIFHQVKPNLNEYD